MELISIDYKDWFINQKRLPDKASQEHGAFFEFHKEICLNGCMMDGVYINPFLYWHLNIWNTEVDIIDERGRISQKYMNPYLRDNEWVITNEIDRAQNEKKGLVILGIRRLAKSVIESSYIAWGASVKACSLFLIYMYANKACLPSIFKKNHSIPKPFLQPK